MVGEFYNSNQQSPKTSTRLAKVGRQLRRRAGCVILIRMSELDERGILLNCAKCGRRNRMRYEGLGQVFRCGQCQCELQPVAEPVDVHNDLAFDALVNHSTCAGAGRFLGTVVRSVQNGGAGGAESGAGDCRSICSGKGKHRRGSQPCCSFSYNSDSNNDPVPKRSRSGAPGGSNACTADSKIYRTSPAKIDNRLA